MMVESKIALKRRLSVPKLDFAYYPTIKHQSLICRNGKLEVLVMGGPNQVISPETKHVISYQVVKLRSPR